MKATIIKFICLVLVAGMLSVVSAKNNVDPAQPVFQQAERLFNDKKYAEAIPAYQELIAKYPLDQFASKSQFRIAECYYLQGKEKEATEQFQLYIINNRRGQEDLAKAFDYQMALEKVRLENELSSQQQKLQESEQEIARLKESYKFLEETARSEEPYLELDVAINRLYVKMGTKTLYDFPVVVGKGKQELRAVGKEYDFTTPRGIVEVISKEENPVWYRPDWYWLEQGEEPPEDLTMEERAVEGALGKYRLNLGGGIGIHSNENGRIYPGRYSHGCIRMNEQDLIKVWGMTKVGTKVYIY